MFRDAADFPRIAPRFAHERLAPCSISARSASPRCCSPSRRSLGLVIANSPVGAAVIAVRDAHLDTGFPVLDLSVGHWITDGLLAIFFLLAAIELRHELTHGELDSPRKALVPAVAAVGGVVVPALVYLLIVRDPALSRTAGRSRPRPTSRSRSGCSPSSGRGLPRRVRALLLALAVIDDLIAILIIAFFFTPRPRSPSPLLLAVPVVAVFGWLSARRTPARAALRAVAAHRARHRRLGAGLPLRHPRRPIAGVALGLVMAPGPAGRTRHALEPWSNGDHPAAVRVHARRWSLIPAIGGDGLSPVFWGIARRAAGRQADRHHRGRADRAGASSPRPSARPRCRSRDVLVVATLGGIGFTVSLLMNELAFRERPRSRRPRARSAVLARIASSPIVIGRRARPRSLATPGAAQFVSAMSRETARRYFLR